MKNKKPGYIQTATKIPGTTKREIIEYNENFYITFNFDN